MKLLITSVALACSLSFGAARASADEKPQPNDAKPGAATVALPDAVAAALAKEFPKAKVEQVTQRGTEEKKRYLVAMTEGEKGATRFKVLVRETGAILMMSTAMAPADLPKPVSEAATAALEGSTIKSATKMEQRADMLDMKAFDKPEIRYEVMLTKDNQTGRIILGDDGKVLVKLKMAIETTEPKPQ